MSDPFALSWCPQNNVSLQAYNTLTLPVAAQYFCHITQMDDLLHSRQYVNQRGINWFLLSGGSNIVLTEDLQGLVMHMAIKGKQWLLPNELHFPEQDKDDTCCYVQVGAGENWDQFVAWSIEQQAYGLQNLSLIPGLVGAAPVQNIGAYGADLSEVLHEVEVYDFETGKHFYLSVAQCELGYRDSIFKRQLSWIIISVTFVLSRKAKVQVNYGDMAAYIEKHYACDAMQATPSQVREAVKHIRASKLPDPYIIPNVGSFFKNPVVSVMQAAKLRQNYPDIVTYSMPNGDVKLAAGWLIDQRGWKGFNRDGVGVHQRQALVLVRQPDKANKSTGQTLLDLAHQIKMDVLAHYSVELQIEPRIFSSTGEIFI
ncbi:MAG: UDP-N-acetylmuramate dehydrogenase [Gammaproteobacteria bacterium]|jgi:UDP-N-acetylmuramate dehydrogenase|nr:UDP-N-acetylmuramate dehydrogenase [Gammaproteobacteria bacterium]MDP6165723.1 UDP-N-acetylmuramate dehydrogenase [Gammaproteobacteria bacterium]